MLKRNNLLSHKTGRIMKGWRLGRGFNTFLSSSIWGLLFLCKVLCKSIRVWERKTFYQSSGNTQLFTLLKSKNVISKQCAQLFTILVVSVFQFNLRGKLNKFRIHLNEKSNIGGKMMTLFDNFWVLFIQVIKPTFVNFIKT